MLVLNYYRTWGADLHAINYWNWHWYGGQFHLLTAWVASLVAWPRHEINHLLVAVTGLIGIAGCWRIGTRLAGPRAGLFGAACLTLTPLYYGQMFTNAKDVPFAAAYIWAVAAIIDAAGRFPSMSWGRAATVGALIGLAMGIRVGGVILLGYLGMAILASAWFAWKYRVPSFKRDTLILVARGLFAVVVAYLVMLVGWPYAQHSPITGPAHALKMFSHFPMNVGMQFRGEMIFSNAVPRIYAPWYVAISLSEPAVLLMLIAGLWAFQEVPRRRIPTARMMQFRLLALAGVGPILIVAGMRSTLYNGMRHLIFVLPPLAVIAGLTLDRWLSKLTPLRRQVLAALLMLWACWHVGLMIRLHPYEYVYANQLAGGMRGAAANYEMDFWGESLNAGAALLTEYVKSHPPARGRSVQVCVCPNPYSARPFLPTEIVGTKESFNADYALLAATPLCPKLSGREVARVERCGVTLTRVLIVR